MGRAGFAGAGDGASESSHLACSSDLGWGPSGPGWPCGAPVAAAPPPRLKLYTIDEESPTIAEMNV